MQSILEQQRHFHEERERLMDCMVKEMQHQTKSVRIVKKKLFRFKQMQRLY